MADQQQSPCRWCGLIHGTLCPNVKALEFDADAPDVVVRVEFVTAADFPQPKIPEPEREYPRK